MPTAAQLEDEADRQTRALEALVERPGLAPLAVAFGAGAQQSLVWDT